MGLKESIEKLKQMDEKERRKKIWLVVGIVFVITLLIGFIFGR
jgi:hypothetical protein